MKSLKIIGLTALAAVVFVVVAVVLFSGGTPTNSSNGNRVPARQYTAVTPTPPDGSAAHPLSFGATSLGGLDLTVSAPTAYHPTSSAFEDPQMPRAVIMIVTVVNHTDNPVSEEDLLDNATVDNQAASPITDSGVGDSVTTQVLPGNTLTYKIAYGIPTVAHTLNVSISTQFGETETFWSGELS